MTAALSVLAWLLGQSLPAGPSAVTADEMTDDRVQHQGIARGHVVLRAGTLTLRTEELHYDDQTGRFTAQGPLFGVDRNALFTASRASGTLGGELVLENVRIEEYQWLPPDAVLRAKSAAEIRPQGKLLMAVEGKVMRRVGEGRDELDGVRISPCACAPGNAVARSQASGAGGPENEPKGAPIAGATGGGRRAGDRSEDTCRPDWALAAAKADVHAGDFALLPFPALRVADLPIPLLRPPVLYVPLAKRRSGLLLPHFNWQSQNGLIIDEPGYLTLGESYDLTVSAGFIGGATEVLPTLRQPSITGAGANGVFGPRLTTELRYAPVAGTTGRLTLSAIDDLHHDIEFGPREQSEVEQRGFRGSLRELQVQDFDAHDGDRLDLSLVSDARLTGQLTTDLLLALIPATRSAAFAFHRSDGWLLTLDGVVLQDFQGVFSSANPHGLLFGSGSPNTLQRLPALTLEILDAPVGRTPLRFSFSGSILREGTLGAAYDNFSLGQTAAGTLIPALSLGQVRASADQLDLDPGLSLPFRAGRFLRGEIDVHWRQDGWLFESDPLPPDLAAAGAAALAPAGTRGYPVADLTLATELARRFSAGLLHTVTPEVELRSIPFQAMAGTVPPLWLTPRSAIVDHATGLTIADHLPLPYDEIALAPGLTPPVASRTSGLGGALAAGAQPAEVTQARLHLDQRLRRSGQEILRLDAGELLDAAGTASTYALIAGGGRFFHLSGFADWSDPALPCPGCSAAVARVRPLAEAWADVGVNDARGDALGASVVRAIAAGAPGLSQPLDLLFSPFPAATDPRWALPDVAQLSASASVHPIAQTVLHAGASYQMQSAILSQVTVGGGYNSPQHCCNLDVTAVIQPTSPGHLGFAALFVNLDLGEFAGSASH